MFKAAVVAVNFILLLAGQQSVDAWWFTAEPAPLRAVATFDMDGVKGTFTFTRKSQADPTVCEYSLQGLMGNNKLFHVHVNPVPQFDPQQTKSNATLVAELCSDKATGGHLNPFKVTAKLPPQSAPFDQYEIGDLSGKHGPLKRAASSNLEDHYAGSFVDDKLPMAGENSIVGRSIVIHKNDSKRWVCATIVEVK